MKNVLAIGLLTMALGGGTNEPGDSLIGGMLRDMVAQAGGTPPTHPDSTGFFGDSRWWVLLLALLFTPGGLFFARRLLAKLSRGRLG